ncbi:hypothetical protein NDU88_004686 [Pleurodeles waltl]|uniref:Uncharacterized protein n=1 Tax=Pleurodeles waltl TaxID=8319 RepID=A0AAV7SJJ6_PLEWA|nr:hypothetical protein NDU88_004686 [Pleurodeles waltl]
MPAGPRKLKGNRAPLVTKFEKSCTEVSRGQRWPPGYRTGGPVMRAEGGPLPYPSPLPALLEKNARTCGSWQGDENRPFLSLLNVRLEPVGRPWERSGVSVGMRRLPWEHQLPERDRLAVGGLQLPGPSESLGYLRNVGRYG